MEFENEEQYFQVKEKEKEIRSIMLSNLVEKRKESQEINIKNSPDNINLFRFN